MTYFQQGYHDVVSAHSKWLKVVHHEHLRATYHGIEFGRRQPRVGMGEADSAAKASGTQKSHTHTARYHTTY